ncbi:MAG: hypothetical protein WBE68_28275, partial [Candidatus Nitrosopolaris sp.]
MGELNKAHIEEKEKIVDRKSDQNLKDKGADSSENNNNIYDDDNRKHKHIVQNTIPKKDKENENQFTAKLTLDSEGDMAKTVLQSIPKESLITSAKFEGPNIALYTKNAKFSLTELTYHLSSLSKSLKKRFVIRTDPSIRIAEEETRKAVVKLLPKDVLVSAVFCDDATGEVVLEVNKPEVVSPEIVVEIAKSTGWIAHTRLSPHIPSTILNTIHSTLKSSAKERTIFLQDLGNRIFRTPLTEENNCSSNGSGNNRLTSESTSRTSQTRSWKMNKEVMLFCLGGVKQVG